jgi:hypothetical protein
MDLKNSDGSVWTGPMWLRIGKAFYQHSSDFLVRQNIENCVHYLRKCYVLKENSAAWYYLLLRS